MRWSSPGASLRSAKAFFLSLLLLSKTRRTCVEGPCPVVSLPQPKPWPLWPCHPLPISEPGAESWLTETQKYVWNSLRGEPPASLPSLVASGSVNIGLERGVVHGCLGVAVLGDTITEVPEQGGSLKPGNVRPSRLSLHQGSGPLLPGMLAWARAAGTS